MNDVTQEVQAGETLSTNPNPLLTTLACTSCANAGTIRTVSLSGGEYVVFPVVPIREGVLNGHFVSSREIERSTPGWNGRPLTLGHPKDQDSGDYVTANSPGAWEKYGIGWVFSAGFVDGRMVAEGWIDKARIAALGRDDLVDGLLTGVHMDVSTGYFCDVVQKDGVFKGDKFNGVQSGIVPDHLALLPDERGACSWDDGCGIPRVNIGGIMEVQEGAIVPEVEAIDDAVVNAAPIVIEDAQVIAAQIEAAQTASDATLTFALPATLVELTELLNQVGGVSAFRDALTRVQSDATARRAEAVNRVVSLSANALAPADVDGLSDDVLAKLAQALQPVNFTGRVANAAQPVNEQWVVLAPGQKGV